MKTNPRMTARIRRKKRVRKKIQGTAERPRMSVFRSNKHIYVQVIDDERGVTLASASSLSEGMGAETDSDKKLETAKKVGELVAQQCLAAKIEKVVFDRNGYPYTGRVAAIAVAARDKGLNL